jgi:hypothetical protein
VTAMLAVGGKEMKVVAGDAKGAGNPGDHTPMRLPSISLTVNSLCALAASTSRVPGRG